MLARLNAGGERDEPISVQPLPAVGGSGSLCDIPERRAFCSVCCYDTRGAAAGFSSQTARRRKAAAANPSPAPSPSPRVVAARAPHRAASQAESRPLDSWLLTM